LSSDRLEDRDLVGLEAIQEMEKQIQTIKQRIKEVQDRHKGFSDAHHVDLNYEVGPSACHASFFEALRYVFLFLLRHYVNNPTHVIDLISLQGSDEGALTAEPIHIMDRHMRQLRRRIVDQVKVQWGNYSPHSVTWEGAYDMCQQFPFLFDS
jgi:hypothetical protein